MAFFKNSRSSNVQPALRINKRHIVLGWYFPTLDKQVLNVKTGSLFLEKVSRLIQWIANSENHCIKTPTFDVISHPVFLILVDGITVQPYA